MYSINNFKKNRASHTQLSKTSNGDIKGEIDASYSGPKITSLTSILSEKDHAKSMKNYPYDNVLLNSLRRITELEGLLDKNKKKLKNSLHEAKEKDIEIVRLKEQIRLLEEEQLDKKASSSFRNDFYALLSISQTLQSRVTAIENFLTIDSSWWNNPFPMENNQHFYSSLKNAEKPNLDLFMQRINELNFEVGETIICQKTKQGGTFKNCQSLSLTCFANGILIEGRPFRPYSSIIAQHFIKDILDGFYPSELQSEFPKGVIFNLCDRQYEFFNDKENLNNSTFEGEGYKLDSNTNNSLKEIGMKRKCSSLLDETETIENSNDFFFGDVPSNFIGFPQVTELKKQIRQSKVGDSVSKNQNCYKCSGIGAGDYSYMYRVKDEKSLFPDIRNKSGSNMWNSERPSGGDRTRRLRNNPRINVLNPEAKITESCITLKICSLNNKDLYILTTQINETIGKVRSYLPYEEIDCSIMYYKDSLNRIYLTDNNSTLKDYGIIKNSVLVLTKQK